jgi:hypothetical protein
MLRHWKTPAAVNTTYKTRETVVATLHASSATPIQDYAQITMTRA